MAKKVCRNIVKRSLRSADFRPFRFCVPHTTPHTLADDTQFQLGKHARHLDKGIGHRVKLFDTGIRAAELINMKLDQIQDSYFVIYGKGRKERVVPKNPAVGKFLYKYLPAREKYFYARNCEDEYTYVFDHYNNFNILALRRMSFYSSEKRFRQGVHRSLPFLFPAYPRPRGRIMAAGG